MQRTKRLNQQTQFLEDSGYGDPNESTLNNRQSLYWRAFKGETGLVELQDMGILTFETLQILTRSERVRKHV
jgi:hypothetical protein